MAGTDLDSSATRLLCLGLGLVFFGRGEEAEVSKQVCVVFFFSSLLFNACVAPQTVQAILESASLKQFAVVTLEACAFAGTGNVLKVQQMLHQCAEHLEKDNGHQAAAVLGERERMKQRE